MVSSIIKKIVSFVSLFYKVFGTYKFDVLILTALGFFSGILGGIGINILIPIFSFIVNPEAVVTDPISKFIREVFLYFNIDFSLKFLLIFAVILFVVKAIILSIFSYITVRILAGYEEKTRSELFRIVLKTRWAHLLKQRLGHLETILITNIQYSQGLFSQVSSAIMVVTSLFAYTAVAFSISWKITLISFGLGGFSFLFLKPLIWRLRSMSYEQDKINRDLSHHINENVVGMKTVKAFSASDAVSRIAENYFRRIKGLKIHTNVINNLTSILVEPISVIFIAFVFVISYKTANFDFASLIAVVYLIKQIFVYLQQLQTLFIGLSTTMPFVRSLIEYEEAARGAQELATGDKPFIFEKELSFEKVSFIYESKKESVLNHLDFSIKKGEMIGVIGPSGAGKTTLVDILLRLFSPTSGDIFLDGVSCGEINLAGWRKNIGYVSQDVFLTNDSICNNIRFYNDTISDKDIEEATKMADIYDFIISLPDGFNANVGERGVLLSGGQKQRIAIARALARKPKLLIFDEATSSLDNESEVKIQNVIKKLKGKLTVIVIAHRLSTIAGADRIIAIRHSKIEEQGTPEVLLKNKESYFHKVYNIRN